LLATPDFPGDQRRNDAQTNAGASETCDTIAIASRKRNHTGKTAGGTDQRVKDFRVKLFHRWSPPSRLNRTQMGNRCKTILMKTLCRVMDHFFSNCTMQSTDGSLDFQLLAENPKTCKAVGIIGGCCPVDPAVLIIKSYLR
jgi:hypothetical protein